MLRMICLIMLTFSVVLLGSEAQSPGPVGSIIVKVVDAHGDAVPSAVVKFCPGPDTATIGGFPECRTDASGSCSKKNLPLDTYYVRAMKPSDGYQDMTFQIYSHQSESIQVVLTPDASARSVLFKFGPKAAVLKVNILDDLTGSEVTNGTIVLRSGSNLSEWIRVNRSTLLAL